MRIRLPVVLALLMWHSIAHATLFSVTNTNDTGVGSLRNAIINANAAGGANTISISATGTITLATPLPVMSFTLTVTGPGAGQLTIHGDGTAPVFTMNGTVQLSGVTLTAGANSGGNGGGIVTSGSLTLLDSAITGSSALLGGGIYAKGSLTIQRSTISGNTGTGAVYSSSDATNIGDTAVIDSTVADNHGTAIVFSVAGKTLTINRSTISGNMEASGIGGLQLQGGTANIQNTTFSGNSGPQGGDFWTFSDGVTLSLLNVTATGGSAPALLFDHASTVTLRNTLLAGPGVRCSGSPTSQGHNLSSDTTCNLTNATDKPGVDPMLGPLAANGGTTKTHTLLAGSPAANAGDNASLATLDQRGKPRVQFAAVDIGAVEVTEPMVVTQPVAQTVGEGEPLTLSVAAMNQNSATSLTYQWRKDGAEIAGATSELFTRSAAAVADSGMYDVLVINDGGKLASMAVAVMVTPGVRGDDGPPGGGDGGGCCSSTGGGAWSSAVFGLVLVVLLGAPRRRRY